MTAAWQPRVGDRVEWNNWAGEVVTGTVRELGSMCEIRRADGDLMLVSSEQLRPLTPAPVEAPRFAVGDRCQAKNGAVWWPARIAALSGADYVIAYGEGPVEAGADLVWVAPEDLRPAPAAPPEADTSRPVVHFDGPGEYPPPPDLVPSTRCVCGAPSYMPLVGPGECLRPPCAGAPREAEPFVSIGSVRGEPAYVAVSERGAALDGPYATREGAIAAWRAAVRGE